VRAYVQGIGIDDEKNIYSTGYCKDAKVFGVELESKWDSDIF